MIVTQQKIIGIFGCITCNDVYNDTHTNKEKKNKKETKMEYRIQKETENVRIITTSEEITVYTHQVNDRMTEIMGKRWTEVQGTKVGEYDRKQGWTVKEIKQRYSE